MTKRKTPQKKPKVRISFEVEDGYFKLKRHIKGKEPQDIVITTKMDEIAEEFNDLVEKYKLPRKEIEEIVKLMLKYKN